MFGYKNESHEVAIERLKETLADLRKRVTDLEMDCRPIRIGPVTQYTYSSLSYQDCRPKVALHDVAEKLMEHCGLTFEREAPQPERITVKPLKKAGK